MSLITKARLIGKKDIGHDRYEFDVKFYSADGAEVALGQGGDNVVLTSTDDLEEGSTHLYYTDGRVNDVIDGRDDLATTSDVTSAVAGKANTTDVNTALDNKASTGYVDAAVAGKASTGYVDSAVSGKADTSDVITSLATKADNSAMTTALAAKADSSAMTTALAAKADASATTTALAAKRDKVNQAKVTMTDPSNDFVEKFEVINDGSAFSGWANRAEYSVTPVAGGSGGASRVVQYLNEYFEWRGNARQNTVLWRAFVREFPADAAHDMSSPIWEIQDDRTNRTQKHGMFGQGNFYHAGDGTVAGGLAVSGAVAAGSVAATGTVTGSNIGVPIKGVYNSGSEPTGQPTGTVILVRP